MNDIVEMLIKIAKPPRQQDVEQARYRKEHKDEIASEAKKKLEEHREKRLVDRAEQIGFKRYRDNPYYGEHMKQRVDDRRFGYIEGYRQAEKDTIERAIEWIKTHWREYIIGPDADGCICFGHWENDFRKAMEED